MSNKRAQAAKPAREKVREPNTETSSSNRSSQSKQEDTQARSPMRNNAEPTVSAASFYKIPDIQLPKESKSPLTKIKDAVIAAHKLQIMRKLTDKPEVEKQRPTMSDQTGEMDRARLIELLIGKEEQIKKEKQKSRTKKFIVKPSNFDYDSWDRIKGSYIVNPEPDDLNAAAEFVDFACNSKLKAMEKGDGGSKKSDNWVDYTPMTFRSAQLNLSINIDELDIDMLKYEKAEAKNSRRNYSPDDITDLAKRRGGIEQRLRSYIDDRFCVYRPSLEALNGDFEGAGFKSVRFSELHFLTYVVMLVEMHSTLTPLRYRRPFLIEMIMVYLPLIIKAQKHKDIAFHLVAPGSHVMFIYRMFDLLNRLDEYLRTNKYIPFRATFGLIKRQRADKSMFFQKEIKTLFANIQAGASLSQMFCEARNMAFVLKSNNAGVIVKHCMDYVTKGDQTSQRVFIGSVCSHFAKQKPYFMKFCFRNGYVCPELVENDISCVIKPPSVFPNYAGLSLQQRPVKPQADTMSRGGLIFDVSTEPDEDSTERKYRLIFQENSSASYISLKNDSL